MVELEVDINNLEEGIRYEYEVKRVLSDEITMTKTNTDTKILSGVFKTYYMDFNNKNPKSRVVFVDVYDIHDKNKNSTNLHSLPACYIVKICIQKEFYLEI